MIAARIFTPATDASCLVCGLDRAQHSHAPACPVTADSLTFDQILDAVRTGVISRSLAFVAVGARSSQSHTQAARSAIAAALNARTTA